MVDWVFGNFIQAFCKEIQQNLRWRILRLDCWFHIYQKSIVTQQTLKWNFTLWSLNINNYFLLIQWFWQHYGRFYHYPILGQHCVFSWFRNFDVLVVPYLTLIYLRHLKIEYFSLPSPFKKSCSKLSCYLGISVLCLWILFQNVKF